MRVHHEARIDAAAADVWDLTIDVESLPSLTDTITDVERLGAGPLAVGSQVRIKQPGQRARVWTVTELDAGRRFVWATKAMGMTMTATHELQDAGGATVNTLTLDLTGATASVFGRLLRGPLQKALATENAGFKQAAERQLT